MTQEFELRFGACPECCSSNGFLSIGPEHWAICHWHRVKWRIGENLFDSWRDQTDKERAEIKAQLADYRTIKPVMLTPVEEIYPIRFEDRYPAKPKLRLATVDGRLCGDCEQGGRAEA